MWNSSHLRTLAGGLVALLGWVALSGSLHGAASTSGGETWHIGLRTDGQAGRGTAEDPLDGSMPERLAAAFAAIPERPLTVRLGPGTFVTRGLLPVKSGWTVRGAGPERTTVQLADNVLTTAEQGVILLGRPDYGGPTTLLDRICVRDLAFDGNRDRQPAYRLGAPSWISALVLWTKHGRIENVHVRNTYSRPGEGFPVTIYSTGGTETRPHRAEIERVWVDRHDGYATSIAAFDQTGGCVTGWIRHCRVTGYGGPPSSAAFGAGGWRRFAVEYNRVEGMAAGVVIDTHDYADVRFAHNVFLRLWKFGFLINGSGRYDRLTIRHNRVQLLAREPGALLKFDSAKLRGLRVKDNSLQGNRYAVPIETGPVAKGVLLRNRLSRGRHFDLPRGSNLQVQPVRN
ncbi:MAG: hypothetical protein JSR82_15755 [Verrucomicrobia bacterium]|nr:hypothetical protein [Verrucomicrobiota bacterium]